jgi:hypothetical protein
MAAIQRAPTTSGRLGQPRQLSGDLLLLARDYLQSLGGRVRVEDEDILSATLPDGRLVRYTTALAKARVDDSATLLVEGSEAVAAMFDSIADHSRLTALRLPPAADPVALVVEQGRQTVHWRKPGPVSARVVQQEESLVVELAFLVVARDRQGRQDEWIRCAVDTTTGQTVPVLSEAALASAQPAAVPANFERLVTMGRASAERVLREPLAATGVFLRQRSLNEYRRRLEEVAATFDRLQRESPETARAVKVGRKRELTALADVYAVDVEAQLESACVIASDCVQVAIRPPKGHAELLVRVDLGRQQVILPDCDVCGTNTQASYVCDAGHAICAECAMACTQCGTWRCSACGESALAICANCGHTDEQPDVSRDRGRTPSLGEVLTVQHLELLPPGMWLTAIEWLLSSQEIRLESRRTVGTLAIWHGVSTSGTFMAGALRLGGRRVLDDTTLRQTAAHLAPEQHTMSRMVLSTAFATREAVQAAEQLGIQLIDRNALEALLAERVSAHQRERERHLDEMQACADAATATRQRMLGAVDLVDRELTSLRRPRRASGRRSTTLAGAASNRALANARTAIERASLAWETLLSDWAESFGERPARNGSLLIQSDVSRFTELGERTVHLQTALLDATALLITTTAHGEAAYTTWRQSVVEECVARCESWRWRIRTVDPAAWSDFDRAWNAKAASKAAEAATAAGHATARADKAQSQALRAG